jgi:hypothetical protein
MKIKITTVILSIFLSIRLFGQDRYDYTITKPVGISSINEAATIAQQIVKAVGLKANFMIAEADVPNALAVLQQGKRYVLYNPGFVNRLTQATGTRWAAISVLAHEIGHHLYNTFAGKPDQTLATELEADQFSGYVLEKMGASLEEAEAAMKTLATPYATLTHPARNARLNSIASGWQNAGGIISKTETVPADMVRTEPLRSTNNRDDHVVFSSASFLARLNFNNDPDKDYFITKRLNIVKIENDEVSILGRVNQSGDESFPFIISGINGYRLYISSRGQIMNAKGYVIGNVTKA